MQSIIYKGVIKVCLFLGKLFSTSLIWLKVKTIKYRADLGKLLAKYQGSKYLTKIDYTNQNIISSHSAILFLILTNLSLESALYI